MRELVRRGDEVIYFATAEFATRISETGAVYQPYQNAFLPELGAISRRMDELAWIFMRTTGEILDQELDAYKALRPDYVVPDSIAPWGHWVAQLLSVPVVTSVTTFAFNRQVLRYAVKHGVRPRGGSAFIISKLRHVAKALSLQRRLRRRYGVPGAGIMGAISSRAGRSLVYTSREFQPCAGTFGDAYAFIHHPRRDEQPQREPLLRRADGRHPADERAGSRRRADAGARRGNRAVEAGRDGRHAPFVCRSTTGRRRFPAASASDRGFVQSGGRVERAADLVIKTGRT